MKNSPVARDHSRTWGYPGVTPTTLEFQFWPAAVTCHRPADCSASTPVIVGPSCSLIALMSSSVRFWLATPAPRRPLSPACAPGVTVTRFEPSESTCCCTVCEAPLPTATIAMTDATPMMTPSIVSDERSLLTMMDCNAERNESKSFTG